MSNMSYVRFENTFHDLQDCYNHISDDDLSVDEEHFRKKLVELCVNILEDKGYIVEEE